VLDAVLDGVDCCWVISGARIDVGVSNLSLERSAAVKTSVSSGSSPNTLDSLDAV